MIWAELKSNAGTPHRGSPGKQRGQRLVQPFKYGLLINQISGRNVLAKPGHKLLNGFHFCAERGPGKHNFIQINRQCQQQVAQVGIGIVAPDFMRNRS
jgi:hypothetical protein